MPDYQNYKLTPLASVSVNVPRVQIEAVVTDSSTGATIRDLTGANALVFPGVITTLTAQQKLDLAESISRFLLNIAAGAS